MRAAKTMAAIVITALLFSVPAQAAGPQRGPGHRPGSSPKPRPAPVRRVARPPAAARRIVVGDVPYWMHGGVFYRIGDNGYIIVSAPVIRVLPRHHRVLVIRGVVYYEADGVYYRTAPGGYVVVEQPVELVTVVAPTPSTPVVVTPDPETITLYVPKRSEDGFVSVALKKLEGGYLGPQGEFYLTMPPVALLTGMYGLPEELRQTRSDVFFIHVPNKDGESFTRVTLTRHNGGFLGPQGEFYPLMPTVAHLAELYGTPAPVQDTTVRIQVPKKNGVGFVEVELKKHGQGYLGPQGELYPELPSADQLKEVYGGQ